MIVIMGGQHVRKIHSITRTLADLPGLIHCSIAPILRLLRLLSPKFVVTHSFQEDLC
jgi:hypothetical protein